MKSTNTTGTLARSVRIALLCGALVGFAATPAIVGQSNSQTTPAAQNQPATPTNNSPASPNTQPAQPNATSQPATDQDQPATSAPAPDSQQQPDPKTDNDQKLPKTASDVPLVGLLGLLSFGSAFLIHTGRRMIG